MVNVQISFTTNCGETGKMLKLNNRSHKTNCAGNYFFSDW